MKDYRTAAAEAQAIVQGHCHHKAMMRLKEEESVMKKMGLDFQLLESGCCGMAGSFGYEKDKYEVSLQCGERALFRGAQGRSLDSSWPMASVAEQIQQETRVTRCIWPK